MPWVLGASSGPPGAWAGQGLGPAVGKAAGPPGSHSTLCDSGFTPGPHTTPSLLGPLS